MKEKYTFFSRTLLRYMEKADFIFLALLFAASALLYLTNLGNIYLWQDEAQTALIAKTILNSGFPMGYDGLNFFSQELGAEYGYNFIWKWHPWFPFYLLALFFKLFGISTFTARLPFALFGIFNIFLLYFFSRSLFENRRVALISATLLLFSVPFILLSRQCRYYSVAAFFSVAGLYAYWAMMQGKRFASFCYFAASTLLFHTHYIYLATLFGTVLVHSVLFYRKRIKTLLLPVLAVMLFNSPWIIWFSTMNYSDQYKTDILNLEQFFTWICLYVKPVNRYVFPAYLIALALFIFLRKLYKQGRQGVLNETGRFKAVSLPLIFITLTFIAVSLVGSAPFFRFLTPTIPVFAMVAGAILGALVEINFFVGASVLIALILHGPLKDLFYELTHDYDGPIEGIVTHLNENALKSDVVAITYGDFPVKFYTGLRVVGGLTGESLLPAGEADWVIVRNNVICEKDLAVRNYLLNNIKWGSYEKVELNFPDIPFENRESPDEHLYRTKTGYTKVILFKKRWYPPPGVCSY